MKNQIWDRNIAMAMGNAATASLSEHLGSFTCCSPKPRAAGTGVALEHHLTKLGHREEFPAMCVLDQVISRCKVTRLQRGLGARLNEHRFCLFYPSQPMSKIRVTSALLICQKSATKQAAGDLQGLREGSVTQTCCSDSSPVK